MSSNTERRSAGAETRAYPSCCTAACCGKIECPPNCRYLPVLQEFKAWRKKNRATQPDPIWCPTVWVAQGDKR